MSAGSAAVLSPPLRHARASLASNVVALYALQIANFVIPLLTLPFLVRELGAEAYGRVAFAYALTYLLVLFVDAGFNTRAARALATCDHSRERIVGIFAATQWIRLGLVAASLLVLAACVACVPGLRADPWIYFASFMTVLGSLMFPTWLFQGLEIMHFTTVCSIGGRLIVTAGIFAWVRGPDDAVLAALLQSSGTLVSGLLAIPIIYGKLGLTLRRPRAELRRELLAAWEDSRALAASEYLSNALTNSGVFVLGLYHAKELVGAFGAVEKLARAGATAFNPVLQALFPRMSAHWHAAPVATGYARRWSVRIGVVALAGGVVMFIGAGHVLALLFGPEWIAHAALLRILLAWFALNVTNAIAAQFWLLSAGHQAAYARRLFAVGVIQVVLLVPLAMRFGDLGAAGALAAAEAIESALLWRAARRLHTESLP